MLAKMRRGAREVAKPQMRSTDSPEPTAEIKIEARRSKRSERYPRTIRPGAEAP